MRRFFRIVRRWLLLALIALLVAGGWTAFRLASEIQYEQDTASLRGADLALQRLPAGGVTNIALFGVDAEDGGTRRSDSVMILSLDRQRGKAKLTSLMRDSQVEIDGHGMDKLTHAYSYGGAALAIRTINQNFGLDIKHFVRVDFSQMANLIGALGGVSVDVKEKELRELNKFIGEYCRAADVPVCKVEQAGIQTLNGIQAMSYARIRKGGTGDDWGRVERQGIVLRAMFDRVQQMSKRELLDTLPGMMKYVTTDLSLPQLAQLAAGMLVKGMPRVEHTRIPADGAWTYGGKQQQYIVFDIPQAAQQLSAYLYEDIPIS